MKVIFVGPFPPPHGGVQTNLVALRDHVRTMGHTAEVINLTRHRRADSDGVFYPQSALATAKLLLQREADILHIHVGGILSDRWLGLCCYASLLPGRKTVLTFHSGGYSSSPQGRATTPNSFTGFALRRLDALIAVNSDIGEFFVRCGVARERIHLISPYSPPPSSEPLPEGLRSFFESHDPVLLGIGGMEPEYDFPLQMDALGELRSKYPDAGLILVGGGSQETELRERAARLAFAGHILLAGDVSHAATMRALRDCGVLLRPTHYDGDAISVREALAMGTPVVATDNGMRPEGCHLIPSPPELPALLRGIQTALAAPRTAPPEDLTGMRNLDAVMDVYRGLLG